MTAVDVAALAVELGFSEYTIREMARTKAIPGHKPTGKPRGPWRFAVGASLTIATMLGAAFSVGLMAGGASL